MPWFQRRTSSISPTGRPACPARFTRPSRKSCRCCTVPPRWVWRKAPSMILSPSPTPADDSFEPPRQCGSQNSSRANSGASRPTSGRHVRFSRSRRRAIGKHALDGTLNDDALLMQGTQAGIWLATICVRVADACFALGGGSALYETSPLQRRLRDLHVAAQHAAVQQRHYVNVGKLVLDCSDPSSTCIMG